MLNYVALGLTLVVSQLILMVVTSYLSVKLISSKWFISKYMEWFAKMTLDIAKEMEEKFEETEL